MLQDWFKFTEQGTSPGKEVLAGATTWVTMAYIVAVNPSMLENAQMDFGAVFVATCLAAAFGSIFMGAVANLPVALAPGLGRNAFFTYSIVIGMNLSWQTALGAVFWSGVIFLILSLTGIRERVVYAMPASIKTGIAVGIGLFLTVIGLEKAGVIIQGEGALLAMGDLKTWSTSLFAVGFVITIALLVRGSSIAVMAGILTVAVIAWFLDPSFGFPTSFVALPPSLGPTFLELEFLLPLEVGFISVVLALLFVDLFDTSGTLVAVANQGGLETEEGEILNLGRAMLADSSATVVGSLLGTSTTTSYIESTTGISVGGRTGLTSIVVGVLFLATLLVAPFLRAIPPYATAPAMFFVAVILIGSLSDFDNWSDFSESAPLVITAVMMPLSFSIADGLAAGILTYVLIKILTGKQGDLNGISIGLAVIFLCKFTLL
ncbi:MAG: NCS2 family permease [Gemmatimonadetes bacterium]|nr:NCS2 family permease [Gemmatimonadota bacterium]